MTYSRMLINLLTLFFFLNIGKTLAVSEIGFLETYKSVIRPWYEALPGKIMKARSDDTKLHYKSYRKASHKKALVILTGRTEPIEKYAEVIFDLKSLGRDIYLLDTRGQGSSERALEDSQKSYVESYELYLSDFKQFMDEVVRPSQYEGVSFLGHSMGGGIGLLYASFFPGSFERLIVSSPMMEIKTGRESELLVLLSMGGLRLIGRGESYIPGGGPSSPSRPFETNKVTRSQGRYEMARFIEKKRPKLIMGSPTTSWVYEAILLTRSLYKRRKHLLKSKVLLFQAGDDSFSKERRQSQFCKELKGCERVFYPKSKHEMLMEIDEVRDDLLKRVRLFLKS